MPVDLHGCERISLFQFCKSSENGPANPEMTAYRSLLMLTLAARQILYEDNHLLVVDKPSDVATMGEQQDRPTIARMAASYLKQKYHKPGNVYVGVVSRLDRLVSGVLVLARTSKAAGRLSEQIRQRKMSKKYMAWVEGALESAHSGTPPSEDWPAVSEASSESNDWMEAEHWLVKNETRHRMQVVPAGTLGAQQARLYYRTLALWKDSSLLDIQLVTGRKHQIRVQLSELGHPILGDRKYGAQRTFATGIALHCYELTLTHPTLRTEMTFRSSPVGHWQNLPEQIRRVLP